MYKYIPDLINKIDLRKLYPDLHGYPVMVYCPFHNDTNKPNMGIYLNNTYCFVCGKYESALGHIQRVRNVKGEALFRLAERLINNDYSEDSSGSDENISFLDKDILEEYIYILDKSADKQKYLLTHYGLSYTTQQEAKLGYVLGYSGSGAYVLPIFDINGELINIRYRGDPPEPRRKYWGLPNRNRGMWYFPPNINNYNSIAEAYTDQYNKNSVILTEGEFDCLALYQIGIPSLSATNGVKALNNIKLLEELAGCNVWIMYDMDEAGVKSGGMVVEKLRELGIESTQIIWPLELGKDASELVANGWTIDNFRTIIKYSMKVDLNG